MLQCKRSSRAFLESLTQFLDLAFSKSSHNDKILCHVKFIIIVFGCQKMKLMLSVQKVYEELYTLDIAF